LVEIKHQLKSQRKLINHRKINTTRWWSNLRQWSKTTTQN
jgi:hypothetical protein